MRRGRAVALAAAAAIVAAGLVAAGYLWASGGEEDRQAEVAERGAAVMPFDLERTTHVFKALPDGGVQTVVADSRKTMSKLASSARISATKRRGSSGASFPTRPPSTATRCPASRTSARAFAASTSPTRRSTRVDGSGTPRGTASSCRRSTSGFGRRSPTTALTPRATSRRPRALGARAARASASPRSRGRTSGSHARRPQA